ncbi:MAG: LysM peptidoglycan-binding domain-containing protein [Polyangiaceae bacterium]|nr:LysM peptidoglycan-binding domain-containing protein [Polyangiaceae bacterium]
MSQPNRLLAVFIGLTSALITSSAFAQEPDAPPDSGGADPGNGGQSAGPGTGPGQVYIPGYPAPGVDINGHLGQSSRGTSDISKSSDGFDLLGTPGGGGSVRGGANGTYVMEGQYVPETHSVKRGDTLWDLSSKYYNNPYFWPRVWAYNPQVLNPHWIYPGDRLKLREPGSATLGNIGAKFTARKALVAPGTIFLRDVGWVDDKKDDDWGEVQGSPDDQMLLAENDDVYIQINNDHEVAVGQLLTIWKPLRRVGSGDAKGLLVSIRGTAKVERVNPKSRMVRAKIIESLDVIERGAKVGPVGRRFDVVSPVVSEVDLEAQIIASVYPYQLYGQNMVAFIDKGEKEGVKAGMRFFAIRRGDGWQKTLKNSAVYSDKRSLVEDDRPAEIEATPKTPDDDKLPDETYAEMRVIRVREHTAMVLVTASTSEVERSARLIARKGY